MTVAALVVAVTACGDAQNAASGAVGAAKDAAGQAGLSAAGQQIANILQVHPVTFTTQSAQLSAQDTQTLGQIAAAVKATGASITVATHAGYPDAVQSQQLSQQRADAIAKVLTGAGVDQSKITSKPTGNATAQGDEALQAQITAP